MEFQQPPVPQEENLLSSPLPFGFDFEAKSSLECPEARFEIFLQDFPPSRPKVRPDLAPPLPNFASFLSSIGLEQELIEYRNETATKSAAHFGPTTISATTTFADATAPQVPPLQLEEEPLFHFSLAQPIAQYPASFLVPITAAPAAQQPQPLLPLHHPQPRNVQFTRANLIPTSRSSPQEDKEEEKESQKPIQTFSNGKRKRWNDDEMRKAIELVRSKKMSARAAALHCNVPRSTLWDRLAGRVAMPQEQTPRKRVKAE